MTRRPNRPDPARKASPWRPPTRRAFVQLIAAGAAAIALRDRAKPPPRPPLWIGHC